MNEIDLAAVGLYIVYYIFPLVLLILFIAIWKNKELSKGTTFFSSHREEESYEILKENMNSIKNLQIYLVVLILLFVPLMNIMSTTLQDRLIQRAYGPAEGPGRGLPYDPVPKNGKIGPSYDTDTIKKEMKKRPDYWHLDDITDDINLEEITNLPGWLTVYYQDKTLNYIVITYNYLSPIPMTRVYGFMVIEDEAFLREVDTVIYPMDPGRVDVF